jgi:hypothetical protein
MDEIRSPFCPGCDELPVFVVGDRQAFCGNDDCKVFTWNLTDRPETFKATAQVIDLGALDQVDVVIIEVIEPGQDPKATGP